jgi:hypothetical protein
MGVMGYALYQYHWRAASIRRGGRGPYDDRVGPVSHAHIQGNPRLPANQRTFYIHFRHCCVSLSFVSIISLFLLPFPSWLTSVIHSCHRRQLCPSFHSALKERKKNFAFEPSCSRSSRSSRSVLFSYCPRSRVGGMEHYDRGLAAFFSVK